MKSNFFAAEYYYFYFYFTYNNVKVIYAAKSALPV